MRFGFLRFLTKVAFFFYFGLIAYNVLSNPFENVEKFTTDVTTFYSSLKNRCKCSCLQTFDIKTVTNHSLAIVKYSYFIQFIAAVGVFVTDKSAILVALVYFIHQAIIMNFASVGLSTSFGEIEEILKVICLTLVTFGFACCGRGNWRSRCKSTSQICSTNNRKESGHTSKHDSEKSNNFEKKRKH